MKFWHLIMQEEFITQISSPSDIRVFSLSEAEILLTQVQKLTKRAVAELEPTQSKYRRLLDCDPRKQQLALDYENIIRTWMAHMQRLGLIVRNLWEVNFHTGDGYLSWKYPEVKIAFFVDLNDPKQTRQSLQEVLEELYPSWAY